MQFLKSLPGNIRFYILLISFSFSAAVYYWAVTTIPGETLQTIRLTQVYAFSALVLLYLALLAGPFCYQMRWFPFRGQYLKARRAIGVSAFYFAFLHAYLAFFGQLGGLGGLSYLPANYLIAISLSFTALLILCVMTLTANDKMIDWMGFPKWKFIHRFIYLAGIFVLIHALMLGTHFQDLTTSIPRISFVLLAFLLYLEARRIDAFLEKKYIAMPKFGTTTLLFVAFVAIGSYYYLFPSSSQQSSNAIGIHSQHVQIAKEVQNANPSGMPNFPGLVGDRTKRFTVDFDTQKEPVSGEETELRFKVYDASSGSPVLLFNKPYEKTMHLIITNSSLSHYEHIHPEQEGSEFVITTTFPADGLYRLYTDFQPIGAIEQQFAFTLQVGDSDGGIARNEPDTEMTKEVEGYSITLSHDKPLLASKLSVGQQELQFTITDTNGNDVTTLEPYLASFGHLVMIHTTTYDYLHVHPTNVTAPKLNERSGPDVAFLPLGLYGPIKPGVYKIFAQFNPDGKLILVDFIVDVQ